MNGRKSKLIRRMTRDNFSDKLWKNAYRRIKKKVSAGYEIATAILLVKEENKSRNLRNSRMFPGSAR